MISSKKKHKDAKIIVDEYRIKESSEIDKISTKATQKFSVQFFQRYLDEDPYRSEMLSLDITDANAELRVSNENDTYLRGIASQIDSILSKRKRKIVSFLTSGPMMFVSAIIFLAPLMIIMNIPWNLSKQHSLAIFLLVLSIFLLLSAILSPILIGYITLKKHVVILLINSNERTSFFSRNKDEIPKMVLGAVIGSLVTILIGGISFLINWLVHLLH